MKGQYMQYSWKLQFYQFRKKHARSNMLKDFKPTSFQFASLEPNFLWLTIIQISKSFFIVIRSVQEPRS